MALEVVGSNPIFHPEKTPGTKVPGIFLPSRQARLSGRGKKIYPAASGRRGVFSDGPPQGSPNEMRQQPAGRWGQYTPPPEAGGAFSLKAPPKGSPSRARQQPAGRWEPNLPRNTKHDFCILLYITTGLHRTTAPLSYKNTSPVISLNQLRYEKNPDSNISACCCNSICTA